MAKCTISIDAITPLVLREGEPFKVTWTVAVGETDDLRNVVVTLLTDDARVTLLDHGTNESPPERALAVAPGAKLTKTSVVALEKRKGLVEETPRENTAAPIFIHARVKNERDEIVADGAGIEVQMHGLARRMIQKMFA